MTTGGTGGSLGERGAPAAQAALLEVPGRRDRAVAGDSAPEQALRKAELGAEC
jgi:hypothetical protein